MRFFSFPQVASHVFTSPPVNIIKLLNPPTRSETRLLLLCREMKVTESMWSIQRLWFYKQVQSVDGAIAPGAAEPPVSSCGVKYLTSLKIQSLVRVFCEVAVKSSQWCLQDFSAWAAGRPADEWTESTRKQKCFFSFSRFRHFYPLVIQTNLSFN